MNAKTKTPAQIANLDPRLQQILKDFGAEGPDFEGDWHIMISAEEHYMICVPKPMWTGTMPEHIEHAPWNELRRDDDLLIIHNGEPATDFPTVESLLTTLKLLGKEAQKIDE